jgi:hypothetical protein
LGEESEKVTTIAELPLVMARDIAEIEVEADTVIAGFSGWNQGYQVEVRKKQDGEIISSHQLSLFFLTGRLASEGRDSTNQCGLASSKTFGREACAPSGRGLFYRRGPGRRPATAHSGLASLIAGHFPNNEQNAGGYQQHPQRLRYAKVFIERYTAKMILMISGKFPVIESSENAYNNRNSFMRSRKPSSARLKTVPIPT